MKKVITLCTALLLTVAITGCGNSAEESSLSTPTNSSSEKSTSQEQETTAAKVVVDPFENYKYMIPSIYDEDSGSSKLNIYPDNFEIFFDSSETPFDSRINFNYSVENADNEKLVIKITANLDNISDFLDETEYAVEKTEEIYEFNVTELTTSLLSTKNLTDDNKTLLIEAMQNYIESFFIHDEFDESEYDNDIRLNSNNPDILSEIEQEKEEARAAFEEKQNLEFTLEKLYAGFPVSETQYFADAYDSNSKIKVSDRSARMVSALFKGNDSNYYALRASNLIFVNGKLNIEDIEWYIEQYINEYNFTYKFPDEDSAFLGATSFVRDIDGIEIEDNYTIEEISLK